MNNMSKIIIHVANARVDMSTIIPNFDEDLPEAFVAILTLQYIKWRLSVEEYDFTECPELPEPECFDYNLRTKCFDMETSMDTLISDMITELKVSPLTTFPPFMSLVDNRVFDNGIDWSKIYLLFAFCGKLSISCLHRNISQVIPNVSDWLTVYIDSRLSKWIKNNGTWTYVAKEK